MIVIVLNSLRHLRQTIPLSIGLALSSFISCFRVGGQPNIPQAQLSYIKRSSQSPALVIASH